MQNVGGFRKKKLKGVFVLKTVLIIFKVILIWRIPAIRKKNDDLFKSKKGKMVRAAAYMYTNRMFLPIT